MFNQYDIAPYAAGPVSVEIPFAEQGELFQKKYQSTKTSYVKELQECESVEADVDGDGKRKQSAMRSSGMNMESAELSQ